MMNFPPKWEILTYNVSRAIGVCNDPTKSNDEALQVLRQASDTFEEIVLWGRGTNFNSGTFQERMSFINMRHEIHLHMISRGVTPDHSH